MANGAAGAQQLNPQVNCSSVWSSTADVALVVLALVNARNVGVSDGCSGLRDPDPMRTCAIQLAEIARQFAPEDGNDESRTSVLSPEAAILIFTSRATKSSKLRDSSSAKLAKEHGVTTKAVRDIWNMR